MFTTVVSVLLLAGTLVAQRGHLDASTSRFHGPTGRKTVVRGADGELYGLSARADGSLLLRRREQGKRWKTVEVAINDQSSGAGSKHPTNTCALAIDQKGELHAIWGSYYYPRYFTSFYRRLALRTGTHSKILPLANVTGARSSSRTEAMAIAVDSKDRVWVATAGKTSWRTLLLRSQPEAADRTPRFERLGSPAISHSAQVVQLAVDSRDRVHCVLFTNRHPGPLVHTWYDPKLGWQPKKKGRRVDLTLEKPEHANVAIPSLATDAKGNVHVSFVDRSAANGYTLKHRRFDGERWLDPTIVATWNKKSLLGSNPNHFHQVACDEATGRVWIVFRDFSTGELVVHAEAAGAFRFVKRLERRSRRKLDYFLPNVRNTLFPKSNRMHGSLDLSYHRGDEAPFQLRSFRVDLGDLER